MQAIESKSTETAVTPENLDPLCVHEIAFVVERLSSENANNAERIEPYGRTRASLPDEAIEKRA